MTVHDPDCICLGNWRDIIKECQSLLGKHYLNREGEECVFYGVVHGDDDYYYGMWRLKDGICSLLSCVGSIDGWGYKLVDSAHYGQAQSGKWSKQ